MRAGASTCFGRLASVVSGRDSYEFVPLFPLLAIPRCDFDDVAVLNEIEFAINPVFLCFDPGLDSLKSFVARDSSA